LAELDSVIRAVLLNTGSETMAEDDETATARYIAGNVSTQLMLKVIIEIISTMADDPDRYRAGPNRKVVELADSMPLAEMDPARETKVRTFVRETIDKLLTSSKPPKPPRDLPCRHRGQRSVARRPPTALVAALPHPRARASKRPVLRQW
jgi:hypothetical protein